MELDKPRHDSLKDDAHEFEALNRLEAFTNLSRLLLYRIQKLEHDAAMIEFMIKLSKYPPLIDAPDVNRLYDFMREVLFNIFRVKLHHLQKKLPNNLTTQPDDTKKPEVFTIISKEDLTMYKRDVARMQTKAIAEDANAEELERSTKLKDKLYRNVCGAITEGLAALRDCAKHVGLPINMVSDLDRQNYKSLARMNIEQQEIKYWPTMKTTHNLANIYVTCVRTKNTSLCAPELTYKKDDTIKQKFICTEGDYAFGWKRPFYGGPKTYGFYRTSDTRLHT